jgi:glycosyltransferase involved in cell wall biosynthesis
VKPPAAPLPRVLYVLNLNPGHKFGSIEEQVLVLADRFRAEGSLFLPLFSCEPAQAKLDFFRERGVEAEATQLGKFRWSSLRRLRRVLRAHRIDVIHWNFTSPLGNPYLWSLALLRPALRHYFTDHISRLLPLTPPSRGPKRWLKALLARRYGKVFCVSRFVQDCLRAQHVWSDRLRCCLHFVNTDRFRPDPATRDRVRRELSAEGQFVVLVVAQLIRAKGIEVLIDALAMLPPAAVLWVVGEGPDRAGLEARVADRGLAERVRVLGHQFDVRPYMQAADCFACPSVWAEAAGLVNLEAAACGLPVVASRIGGIPEYLDDGRTGLLFPPGDARALADCLVRLLHDRGLAQGMGEAAREMAVRRFSIDARLDGILDLYRA